MWFAGPTHRGPDAGRPAALRPGFDLKPGMRVGLYGGSFNPAHEGHTHVADTTRRRLGLDRVIWLVSPQNPLKRAPASDLAARMANARGLAHGPAMIVSDIEARLGTAYTVDVVRQLKARFPGVRFVWLMGADNLMGFHRWRGWTEIMRLVPVAVVARPGFELAGGAAVAAKRFSAARRPQSAARTLADARPPAWTYLTAPLRHVSSTALRRRARVQNPPKNPS
jgi:nicotinate-nucleotide adenylyltransferase